MQFDQSTVSLRSRMIRPRLQCSAPMNVASSSRLPGAAALAVLQKVVANLRRIQHFDQLDVPAIQGRPRIWRVSCSTMSPGLTRCMCFTRAVLWFCRMCWAIEPPGAKPTTMVMGFLGGNTVPERPQRPWGSWPPWRWRQSRHLVSYCLLKQAKTWSACRARCYARGNIL